VNARSRTLGCTIAALLACSGCTKDGAGDSAGNASGGNASAGASGGGSGGEPTPIDRGFDRVVREELTAIGRQPGFIADGLVYAAIRPIASVAWLRKIPLPADASRDLAELSRETGVDWRAEDLQRRFALAPDAVISMTLFRPMTTGAREVRGELARGGTVLQAMTRVLPEITGNGVGTIDKPPPIEVPVPVEPPKAPPPPKTKEPEVVPISPPIPPDVIDTPPPPEPPPIPPETLDDARDAIRRASGLGLHSRVVVPVTDPEPLVQWIRGLGTPPSNDRMSALCPTLPQSRLCFADGDTSVVVRSDAASVSFDVFMFIFDSRTAIDEQSSAIRTALELKPIETGRPLELRGDAAAEMEASAIIALAEVDGIRRGLSGMRWGDTQLDDSVRRALDGIESIERLASAPMLFTGARLEAGIGNNDRLQAELRWLALPERRADNDALLTAMTPSAPVPSFDGLCNGAVACARTRGLPKPSSLSEKLANGVWAARPDEFENTFGKNDDLAMMHVFAASWPNLAGAAARWPALEVGDGPEGAMVRNLVDVIGRIEGFGGSLRNFSIGQRIVQGDYAVYARTTAADAGIVRGFLTLAEQSMTEITVSGVTGTMFSWTVPEDDFPATVISRVDPPAAGAAQPELGWIALVDGADRMAWLLGLPQEAPDGPPAYLEIPDLARALPTVPEIERDIGFLRGFFGGLALRAMLDIDAGEPRITAVLARGGP
jgi:hypothetical protein